MKRILIDQIDCLLTSLHFGGCPVEVEENGIKYIRVERSLTGEAIAITDKGEAVNIKELNEQTLMIIKVELNNE